MKRISNIYSNIYDTKNIINIYKFIRTKVKNKKRIETFENNYTMNISYIKKILENKTYRPSKYNIFLIRKPKYRIIMSQNMIDKIVSHLCSKYLLIPYLEKSLIDTNVATRKNKGISYGIRLLRKYLNCVNKDYYYLKFDISKYFYNIDHEILKELLLKKIKDKDVLNIVFKLIDSTNYDYINKKINLLKTKEIERYKNNSKVIKEIENIPIYKIGKGLSIGSMLNQFLAIFYLSKFDHFIKETLKIKYYIRYMDDGILIHKDKMYLEYCLREIKKELNKYKLNYNDKKTKIGKVEHGINYLGFNFYLKNKLIIKVNNSIKNSFKRKRNNKDSLCGYKGHFSNCTSNLYYKILNM